jgi:curli biogenesis system outer membrane secretion channel CsgG
MKRILVVVLLGILVAMGLVVSASVAQEKKEKPAVAVKEVRWHGQVVRLNTDTSTIDVRKGAIERRIHYDSSTKWTKGTKTIEMSEVKDGSVVICMVKADEKGELHAIRVDLRR